MHPINLHGPWILSTDSNSHETFRSRFPCRLAESQADTQNGFWLCRKFHAPTGAESESIHLEFSLLIDPVEITLNDKKVDLEVSKEIRFDVTNQLNRFNQICIRFEDGTGTEEVFQAAKMLIG